MNTRLNTTPAPTLSAAARKSLDRYIEQALRQRFGADGNLRKAVRQAVTEMGAAGASGEAIRALLTRSVQEHPRRYTCDRVSIVTGLLASDLLTRRILGWAEQPWTSARASTAHRAVPDRLVADRQPAAASGLTASTPASRPMPRVEKSVRVHGVGVVWGAEARWLDDGGR